jgi:hypothetical protein
MNRHRDTSARIWRTVVFAGAMLGAPACHHDNAATTLPAAKPAEAAPTTPAPEPTPTPTAMPDTKPATDPAMATPTTPPPTTTTSADPCGGGGAAETPVEEPKVKKAPVKRPRGGGDRPTGRGFVLS